MNKKLEQRANIKFCVKLGKSATETLTMLRQVYSDEAMSRSQIFDWHSRFQHGRISLDDDERSGRPSTSIIPENVEKIRQLVHNDRRSTIKELAEAVGISYGSVQAILTSELHMHRIAAKFVPRLLTADQKEHRVEICQDLRQRVANDPSFLAKIVTGDETWVYSYDPETKQQSSQWKSPSSPRLKKARQSRSSKKIMLIIFFDSHGIVHQEFVPQGQTVNKVFYCEVLRRLREKMRKKRQNLWRAGDWILHDDNAPCHRALVVREFLAQHKMSTLPHPPYSPDLAPADFFLFPKMKLKLKGRHFDTVEDIQRESRKILNSIPESDFEKAFQKWQKRWDKCIAAEGNYFEGDNVFKPE